MMNKSKEGVHGCKMSVEHREPILLSQCPQIKMDLRGLMKYAKSKGKLVFFE